MTEPPVGTITFIFTDLETSTRLWEQQPDAMRAALAEHDAVELGDEVYEAAAARGVAMSSYDISDCVIAELDRQLAAIR